MGPNKQAAGRLGGLATFERHGIDHMRQIASLPALTELRQQQSIVFKERGKEQPLPPLGEQVRLFKLRQNIVRGSL